jgi:hypothetical protein
MWPADQGSDPTPHSRWGVFSPGAPASLTPRALPHLSVDQATSGKALVSQGRVYSYPVEIADQTAEKS